MFEIYSWIFAFLLVYFVSNASRINTASVIFIKLLPCFIGLIIGLQESATKFYVLLCFAAYSFSYVLAKKRHLVLSVGNYDKPYLNHVNLISVLFACFLIVSLTLYHFYAAGIPIFGDVIRDRFDVMKSGLFGLPSRSYLIGLPLIYIMLIAVKHQPLAVRQLKKINIYILVFLVFLVIVRALGGFKGAVLEVFFLTIIVSSALGKDMRVYNFIKNNFFKLSAIIGIILIVSSQYTDSINKYSGLLDYLFVRIFYMTSEPDVFILTSDQNLSFGNYFINDILFQLKKWFNFSGQNEIIADSTTHVFAGMSGYKIENVVNSGNHVPVTISFISMGFVNFGYLFGFLSCALTGLFLGYLENKVLSPASFLKKVFYILNIYIIYTYTIKGNLIYMIVNWYIIFAAIAICCLLVRFFLRNLATKMKVVTLV